MYWKEHAYGDQYKATDKVISGKREKLKMTFTSTDGETKSWDVFNFDKSGSVAMCIIRMNQFMVLLDHALTEQSTKNGHYLSTKNTILKAYDGRFKDIFHEVFESEFKSKFQELNITYEHRLIDDMVAAALKWNGNFVWACKNYDGDVQSDTVAQGFGSLGLMTSTLLTLMVK